MFLLLFFRFFFFKQKTAYEIVSRDWSSDVCSSDLPCICEIGLFNRSKASCIAFELAILILVHQSSQLTIFQIVVSYNTVYLKKKNIYAEIHPNLRLVYTTIALVSIQLPYCTLPFLISLSRLIMVLQIIVLSELVVVKAC